ncbi:hypothetical protein NRA41_19165 [Acinetobacter baumannii]|nr:hypothetical protein [Acinetobacter baumannii]
MNNQSSDPEKILEEYDERWLEKINNAMNSTPDHLKLEKHQELSREFMQDPFRFELKKAIAEKIMREDNSEVVIDFASLAKDGFCSFKLNDNGAVGIQQFTRKEVFK